MTGLLVSVRSESEARIALDAGADFIDVKEPFRGSLGAADADVVRQIGASVGRRVPLSLALGELAEHLASAGASGARSAAVDWHWLPSCFSYAKLGLAGCSDIPCWWDEWARTLGGVPKTIARVAVAYADWRQVRAPSIDEVVRYGAELGCGALLVDTHGKERGTLLDYTNLSDLHDVVTRVRTLGMCIVIGGSVSEHVIPQLLPLEPDYIAVRGAVCRAGRSGHVDPARVRQLVKYIKNDE